MTEEKKNPALSGYREAVMLMRSIAELAEKHPEIDKPRISFGAYDGDRVRYSVWAHRQKYDYNLSAAERDAAVRLAIEAGFNTITEFFGPGLEWTANDPSEDSHARDYFILSTVLSCGAALEILAQRSQVGEDVGEMDSGPEISDAGGGYLQAVRTTVTMWRPNIALTALARPGTELTRAAQRLAVEA